MWKCWDTALWDSDQHPLWHCQSPNAHKQKGEKNPCIHLSSRLGPASPLSCQGCGRCGGVRAQLVRQGVEGRLCMVALWGKEWLCCGRHCAPGLCPKWVDPLLYTYGISQWKKLSQWSCNVYIFVPVRPWAFVLKWCLPTSIELQQVKTAELEDRTGVRTWAVPLVSSRTHPNLEQFIENSRFPLDLHQNRKAEAPEKFMFPEELCTLVQSTPTLFSGLFFRMTHADFWLLLPSITPVSLAVIQLFSFWTPSENLVNPSLPRLESNENNMKQFPEMPSMLDAQPPFSAELSHSFSAGAPSALTAVGTAGKGMFAPSPLNSSHSNQVFFITLWRKYDVTHTRNSWE